MPLLFRLALAAPLIALAGWGICLRAPVATAATVAVAAALLARRPRLAVGLALVVVLAGLVEVPLAMARLGARSRAGSLTPAEQAGVAGINVALAGASTAGGFSDFGWETLVMLSPVSFDGPCPADRLAAYGERGSAPLRSWSSDLPMRSERFRGPVRTWAASLPVEAAEGETRRLGPLGPFTWPAADYIASDEANRVPVALNTPTTTLEGRAVRTGGRWRLELVVHLFVAYPERATLQAGPVVLEEGMFADAPLFLHPYCAEYRFERTADDPSLQRTGPIRGPFERGSTALLRAVGAGLR